MAEYIPEINWTDFVKIVKSGRINELKSCEVKFNGEVIFTAEIYHGDMHIDSNIRLNAETLAVKSNIVAGKDPEELLTPAGVG